MVNMILRSRYDLLSPYSCSFNFRALLSFLIYSLQIKYHPFMLNPSAPKEGVVKKDYYMSRFGPRSVQMESRMAEVSLLSLFLLPIVQGAISLY